MDLPLEPVAPALYRRLHDRMRHDRRPRARS
jgi:hypothetical protein